MGQGKLHVPTEKTRQIVKNGAAFGVRQDLIAAKLGIAKTTLIDHYREELDLGMAEAHFEVGETLKERAMKSDLMGIFYAKTQMGWSETIKQEITMPNFLPRFLQRGRDDD